MKTRILPAVIGIILASGMAAAQADAQIFGHLDLSIDSTDTDGGSDDINMNSNTSSVGFKGSEDLGNGLKAIFKIDFQFDMANRQREITDRDQWIGLKGNFGQVRVGTISTGYKSHGALLDPLYRTSLQGRSHGLQSSSYHSGAGEDLEGRADNTFRYDSPDFNGLKAVAHYTLDSDERVFDSDGDLVTGVQEDEDAYGIGASYASGGILVFADYLNQDGTLGSPIEDTEVWKLGGKYSLGSLAVMAQYENIEEGTDESDLWHIGGSFTMGNSLLYFGYGQGDADNSPFEYDAWTLAAMHSLSKRTQVYAGFNEVDCDVQAADTVCKDVTATGGEVDQFSLGMKHRF